MIIIQVFTGNQDVRSVVSNKLRQPITARYIRFKPLSWNYVIGMRTEIYGFLGIVKTLFYAGHVVGNLYSLWGGGELSASFRLNRNRLC